MVGLNTKYPLGFLFGLKLQGNQTLLGSTHNADKVNSKGTNKVG